MSISNSKGRSHVPRAVVGEYEAMESELAMPIEVADAEEILKERDACGVRV